MKLIRDKLDDTRRQIKVREAATVGLSLLTFTVVFLAVEVVLDRLFLLDRRFRAFALMAFAGLGTVLVFLGIGLAFRRISLVYAARVLERHQPALRQSLTTYVQMRLGAASGSGEALSLIESRLAQDLKWVNLGGDVRRWLTRLSAASAAIMAVSVGIAALVAGPGFFVCVQRVVRPGAAIAPPTETRIVEVLPGDRHELQSTDIEVTARMSGVAPSEAKIYLTYGDGSWFALAMRREESLWRATIPGSQVSCRYFIAAGDTKSDSYRITVLPPPVMTNLVAVVSMPSYASPAPRQINGGDLQLLPQSTVTLRCTPNRPFKSADVVFETGARLPFRLKGTDRANLTFSPTASGGYWFDLVDEHGLRNPRPQKFRLEIRPDRPPEVDIVQPGPVTESLPGQPVEITVDAADDFGIVQLTLVSQRRGADLRRMILPFDPAQGGRQKFTMSPAQFDLAVPDSMLFYVEAQDGSPTTQQGRSAIHVLHVRRRPLDALEPFEDLRKSLQNLVNDESLRKRLDLEDEKANADRRPGDTESRRRERELADRQSGLAKQIRDLGMDSHGDLKRLREELKKLQKDLAEVESATRDLPSRGLQVQESLARRLAEQAKELQRKLEAAKERLDRLSKAEDQSWPKSKLLAKAAQDAESAARQMEAAARAMEEREADRSQSHQFAAQNSLEAARKVLDDLLAAELSEADRLKAEELAKLEKKIRELTEELAAKADREEARRLRQAAEAMKKAQQALEQGRPGAAQDQAEEAAEKLDPEEPEDPAAEAAREPDEEQMKSLKEFLRAAMAEQDALREVTKEIDDVRAGGVLKAKDQFKLRDLGRRERILAGKFGESRRELEKELAGVFRWVMAGLEEDLLAIGDLLEIKERSDAEVRDRQQEISRRIAELIEALETKPKAGAGGGKGGGQGPQVNLEKQLRLIRTLQAGLTERTRAIRARMAAGKEKDPGYVDMINKLMERQEELRLQLEKLIEAIQKK